MNKYGVLTWCFYKKCHFNTPAQ